MLRRGFKSWCESVSVRFRKNLGKDSDSPLSPHELAAHLNIKLKQPAELPNISRDTLNTLLQTESDSWSAVTLSKENIHLIIYNNSHAATRQANDIMHELSHIILQHRPQANFYSKEAGALLRQYDQNQEDEADCLARILLLPRDALFKIKSQAISHDQAARVYGVSKPLFTMRWHLSGIDKIYKNHS